MVLISIFLYQIYFFRVYFPVVGSFLSYHAHIFSIPEGAPKDRNKSSRVAHYTHVRFRQWWQKLGTKKEETLIKLYEDITAGSWLLVCKECF